MALLAAFGSFEVVFLAIRCFIHTFILQKYTHFLGDEYNFPGGRATSHQFLSPASPYFIPVLVRRGYDLRAAGKAVYLLHDYGVQGLFLLSPVRESHQ
jgi:hypothetical protein